jgi:hypothetical protein
VSRGRPAQRSARQSHGLPALRPPPAHRRQGAHPPAGRRRHLSRALDPDPDPRPPRLRRSRDVSRARARGAGQDRPERGDRDRHGDHRRYAVRARRDGLRLHGRQHGQRRGREALAQRRAGRRRGPAAGRGLYLRGRAHAGGYPQPHADGQDELRRRPHQRGDVAVRRRAGRPVHRRRRRQLRDARRRLHRRARRAAVLLRAAGDRPDHSRGAARGLQHRGAQPRTRPPRRGRRAQGPPREGRQLPPTAGRR